MPASPSHRMRMLRHLEEQERLMRSVRARFAIKPVQQVGEVVSIFHGQRDLPATLDGRGRIGRRVPNGPAVIQLSKFIAHARIIALALPDSKQAG